MMEKSEGGQRKPELAGGMGEQLSHFFLIFLQGACCLLLLVEMGSDYGR